MDVYAQLQQRVDREHGRAFDALVRQARGRLYGGNHPESTQWFGQWGRNGPFRRGFEARSGRKKRPC